MKCDAIKTLLVSYVNNETTPAETAAIRAHLPGCLNCQQQLALLTTAQNKIGAALVYKADHALPSAQAWSQLQARLTLEAHPSQSRFAAWLSHFVTLSKRSPSKQQLSGGNTMYKRLALVTTMTMLAVGIVAVSTFNTVTSVSARDILNRAYQVEQASTQSIKGIHHTRYESYYNEDAGPESQGIGTVMEGYHDFQTGNGRTVITNSKTGQILVVESHDEKYEYNGGDQTVSVRPNEPLTVYRNPLAPPLALPAVPSVPHDMSDDKSTFDKMRNDPNVQLLGQETWQGGRVVNVLRSQEQVRLVGANNNPQSLPGVMTAYFDVKTYEFLGGKESIIKKDGTELVISSKITRIDETLPEGSFVAWDLSDLKGVNIIDDKNGTHRFTGFG